MLRDYRLADHNPKTCRLRAREVLTYPNCFFPSCPNDPQPGDVCFRKRHLIPDLPAYDLDAFENFLSAHGNLIARTLKISKLVRKRLGELAKSSANARSPHVHANCSHSLNQKHISMRICSGTVLI